MSATHPARSPLPLSQPSEPLDPAQAADLVMSRCLRGSCFGPEEEFWNAFARTYSQVEARVDPERRFVFATRVDARLVEMGLAPWSVMSRLAANGQAGGKDFRAA